MIRELLTIQYLRAIAALMIVLHHLPVQLHRLGYDGRWPEMFNSRVDIFFVISGFIIWATTAGRETSIKDFLTKRLIRIVPLYWLVTAFCVAVMLAAPKAMQSSTFDAAHVLASFAFWPQPHPVTGFIAPVIVPAWSLLYEMAFYAVFALCLPLSPKARLLALSLVLALLVSLQPLFPIRATVGGFYTSSIILEFAFGAAIAALFLSGVKLPAIVSVLLMTAGSVGLALRAGCRASNRPRDLLWRARSTDPDRRSLLRASTTYRAHPRPGRHRRRLVRSVPDAWHRAVGARPSLACGARTARRLRAVHSNVARYRHPRRPVRPRHRRPAYRRSSPPLSKRAPTQTDQRRANVSDAHKLT